ncbi:uncharacterized protein LOC128877833 [Hylaeus volcanicus]|nr:uncharacterized protein LOC128877833 [Hylaeus volcanicus]
MDLDRWINFIGSLDLYRPIVRRSGDFRKTNRCVQSKRVNPVKFHKIACAYDEKDEDNAKGVSENVCHCDICCSSCVAAYAAFNVCVSLVTIVRFIGENQPAEGRCGPNFHLSDVQFPSVRFASFVSDTMSDEDQLKSTIDGILPFLQSIEWRDPWLALLLTFHIAVTMTALMTRNHANFQIMLFLALLLLVYFSESINEVAASNWMLFSRQQYFDSNGLFISIVFSVPILVNCMIMIASWLYQSSQLMTSLKRAQLRQQARNRQIEDESVNVNGTVVREKQE